MSTSVKIYCSTCGNNTTISLRRYNRSKKRCYKNSYCSKLCQNKGQETKKEVTCLNCKSLFLKWVNQIKRLSNHFCSSSCSATYNNKHKKYGIRRSKLEVWLENQLTNLYLDLKFCFNQKDTINSELDIYIPSLKLAFELNGIFHYEPIYGQEKLDKIQNNDHCKFQACSEAGISLCIIDTSQQKYFKPATSQKYLDIIIGIIDDIGEQEGSRTLNPKGTSF